MATLSFRRGDLTRNLRKLSSSVNFGHNLIRDALLNGRQSNGNSELLPPKPKLSVLAAFLEAKHANEPSGYYVSSVPCSFSSSALLKSLFLFPRANLGTLLDQVDIVPPRLLHSQAWHGTISGKTNPWHNIYLSMSTSTSPDLGKKPNLTTLKPAESSGEGREKAFRTHLGDGWINNYLPSHLRPFALLARLDKPVGTWLLAWPCFWSIALAAPAGQLPDVATLALFGAGALLLRGAGCTVNDLLDRQIDAQVERTRSRPLAAGTMSPFQGVAFLGVQLLLGLGILLQLNTFSQILGASSLLLVFTYPLMKRVTYWPQAYLGLTFNWGALLGWAAVRDSLDLSVVLPLYAACISWTLVYDTIYAHQDKNDDLKVGVKSTALLFGKQTPVWLSGFSSTTILGLALAGHMAGLGWAFPASLLAAGGHLAWQVAAVDYNNQADCGAKFASNKWLGAIVFAGVVAGKLTSPF